LLVQLLKILNKSFRVQDIEESSQSVNKKLRTVKNNLELNNAESAEMQEFLNSRTKVSLEQLMNWKGKYFINLKHVSYYSQLNMSI